MFYNDDDRRSKREFNSFDEKDERFERKFVVGFAVVKAKKGFCVSHTNREGKVFYTDAYKLWMRSRDGMTPITQAQAQSLIEEFRADDLNRKKMYGHLIPKF